MTTTNPVSVAYDRIGTHLTMYLSGELDCASVEELAPSVLPHVHPTDRRVWVDLSAVTFCGSAGLTLFIQLHNRVRDQGGHLSLYGPQPSVLRSIRMCRLDEVLTVFPSVPTTAQLA